MESSKQSELTTQVTYKAQNYPLLQELYGFLRAFPFNVETVEALRSMDLNAMYVAYSTHSAQEEDKVADTIRWSVSVLQALLDKRPVRVLDELLVHIECLLKREDD